ncbi:hypothetical protein C8Q75DRAFT_495603 [Abortiporus biennis]|nr:hypothetical protein C8Q75DRAFT_495603 [Abortiporus biennis]
MVDWNSPEELQADALAFSKMCHAVAGIYFWDFATTLDFEWEFITRKRRFRWPMIFYFASRYMLLFSIIGQLIALDVTNEVNCDVLYTYNAASALITIGLASINLAIRTVVIWSYKWYIIVPLVIGNLGFWGITGAASTVQATWTPGVGCFVSGFHQDRVIAGFILTICYDFSVLALAVFKLTFGVSKRTKLMNLMFKDGLIYFVIVCVANIPATTFMILALNPVMASFFDLPVAVTSTMVACRAVRRLHMFTNGTAQVIDMSSSKPPSTGGVMGTHVVMQRATQKSVTEGVHIQMSTFEHTDAESLPTKKYDADDL